MTPRTACGERSPYATTLSAFARLNAPPDSTADSATAEFHLGLTGTDAPARLRVTHPDESFPSRSLDESAPEKG